MESYGGEEARSPGVPNAVVARVAGAVSAPGLRPIVARYLAGDLSACDVLEVGPGPGGLTRGLLAEGARHVLAVEAFNDNREAGMLFGFAKLTRDLSASKRAEETARELDRQRTARMVAEAGEARAAQVLEHESLLSSHQRPA